MSVAKNSGNDNFTSGVIDVVESNTIDDISLVNATISDTLGVLNISAGGIITTSLTTGSETVTGNLDCSSMSCTNTATCKDITIGAGGAGSIANNSGEAISFTSTEVGIQTSGVKRFRSTDTYNESSVGMRSVLGSQSATAYGNSTNDSTGMFFPTSSTIAFSVSGLHAVTLSNLGFTFPPNTNPSIFGNYEELSYTTNMVQVNTPASNFYTTTQSIALKIKRIGNMIVVHWQFSTGTPAGSGNNPRFTQAIPSGYRPVSNTITCYNLVVSNSFNIAGAVRINLDGTIYFYSAGSANISTDTFSGLGSASVHQNSVSYFIA